MLILLFIASIAIAAFIGWSIANFYKKQMSNVETPSLASEYIADGSFHLHSKKDSFLYSDIQRVPRDNDRDKDD